MKYEDNGIVSDMSHICDASSEVKTEVNNQSQSNLIANQFIMRVIIRLLLSLLLISRSMDLWKIISFFPPLCLIDKL